MAERRTGRDVRERKRKSSREKERRQRYKGDEEGEKAMCASRDRER